MTVRLVVATVCFVIAIIACVTANVTQSRMITALHRHDGRQIYRFGRGPRTIWNDYARIFPDSPLPHRAKLAVMAFVGAMLVSAVAIGIIPIFGHLS